MTQKVDNVEPMDEDDDLDLMNPMDEEDTGTAPRELSVGEETDISGDGGIIKKLLVAGTGWELPQKDDRVFVHYTGTLTDGSKFDSSVDRDEPFSFTLGHSQVIKGWDKVVATMKKGEKVQVTLAPQYAYGESGSHPKIPPSATLIFEIELLRWESVNDLSPEKDGSLMKRTLQEGDLNVWDKPKEADLVVVSYTACVEGESMPFAEGKGAEFRVADGHFCPAIKEAVLTMKEGERVELKAHAKWAFGDKGCEGCPPDSRVTITLSLEAVKSVKFIDPDHKGEIVKTILHNGAAYHTPNNYAAVTVSWTATLQDGTKFDEMSKTELNMADDPFPCEALELAVASMRNGEEALIKVMDPKYGFGEAGLEGVVPPGELVCYHVTLHDFKDGPENYELDGPAKVHRAEQLKERGNKAFKVGALWKAQRMYDAVESLSDGTPGEASEEDKGRLSAIHMATMLNLAAIALKEGKDKKCLTICSKVLEKHPQCIKALFRKSQAHTNLGDYIEAQQELDKAIALDSSNSDLLRANKRLKQLRKEADKKDARLFGAMFSKVGTFYQEPKKAADAPVVKPPVDTDEPMYEGEAV